MAVHDWLHMPSGPVLDRYGAAQVADVPVILQNKGESYL